MALFSRANAPGCSPPRPGMVESIQVECDLVKFSYIINDGLYFQSLTARSSSQLGQAGPIRQGAKRVLYLCNRCRLAVRSEEHTSELQSRGHLVCRLLLEKKKQKIMIRL